MSGHYYIEGQRIVSKLGSGLNNNGKGQLKARQDKVNYGSKQQQVREGIVKNLKFLGIDGAILTAGNSGKTPPGQLKGGKGGSAGGGKDKASEKFQYFYHPDHLGSSSYITDASGEVYQHLEYFAFGETFVEEHSNTHRTPYLFNGKELDEETGLYYYGARYYDAKTSIWLAVDPLAEKYPNVSPYNYVLNNPVRLTDPDGRSPCDDCLDFAKGVGIGLYGGVKGSITGLVNTIAHPIETAKGIGNAVVNYEQTGRAIAGAVGETVDKFQNGSAQDKGEVVGQGLALVGEAIVGAKGAGLLLKSKTAAQVASKVDDVANISPNVKRVLGTLDEIKAEGGAIKSNALKPNQELNMTIMKGAEKVDLRVETHTVPKRYGGNGTTPQRHMNVDLHPKNSLPNKGHKLLE